MKARRLIPWAAVALVLVVAALDPFGVVAQVGGPFFAPNGSRQKPAYTYTTSTRLGSYRIEQDNEGFAADGILQFHYTTGRLHIVSGTDLRVGGALYVQSAAGIGTDNPTSRLHVIGGVEATGAVSIGGLLTTQSVRAATDNQVDLGQSAASRFRDAFFARNLHVAGFIHVAAAVAYGVHAVTIADDGTGNGNAEVVPGLYPVLRIECLDTQGCMLRFHEASISAGTVIRVVNVGAQNMIINDHATVGTRQHVAGTFTGGKNDTMQLILMPDTSNITSWYELSRSDN